LGSEKAEPGTFVRIPLFVPNMERNALADIVKQNTHGYEARKRIELYNITLPRTNVIICIVKTSLVSLSLARSRRRGLVVDLKDPGVLVPHHALLLGGDVLFNLKQVLDLVWVKAELGYMFLIRIEGVG
jgi:hypothetical protein